MSRARTLRARKAYRAASRPCWTSWAIFALGYIALAVVVALAAFGTVPK